MIDLLICFLSLKLCISVDIAPAPGVLSPQVYHGTLFEDGGIGLHSCYHGEEIWELEVGQSVLFNGTMYKVSNKQVYTENGKRLDNNTYFDPKRFDLYLYTCWQPDWRDVCFVSHDGWDWRLIIGLTKMWGLEP